MASPRVLLMTSDWPRPKPGVARPPTAARRQAEALHDAGLTVEIFAFRGGGNLYNYAVAWARLRPRFRARRYDLVHAHFAKSGLLALPKRAPLVVTFRAGDLSLGARILARRADAVIVPSEEMGQQLRTRTPVHVIPPDLDEPALTARLLDVYRSVLPGWIGL